MNIDHRREATAYRGHIVDTERRLILATAECTYIIAAVTMPMSLSAVDQGT